MANPGAVAADEPMDSTSDGSALESLMLGLADTFAVAIERVRATRSATVSPPGGHAAPFEKVLKTYQQTNWTRTSSGALDSAA
jgi:hypothetical protein